MREADVRLERQNMCRKTSYCTERDGLKNQRRSGGGLNLLVAGWVTYLNCYQLVIVNHTENDLS